jgi:hypothetical protein
VGVCQTLQTNGEFDITTSDDVLDLEIHELGVESELLDDTSVLARSKSRVIFRLGTRNDHLARREDQRCRLWIANTHDNSGETLQDQYKSQRDRVKTYLGVILRISGVQGNGFQVETTIKVDCCNDISSQSLAHVQRQRLKGTHCRVGTMPDTPPVVTVSFSSAPFPFVAVVAVPFIPAPF